MGWTKIEALGWAVQVKEGIDAESLRAVALEAIGSVIELLDEQEAVRAALWRGGLREVDFAEDGTATVGAEVPQSLLEMAERLDGIVATECRLADEAREELAKLRADGAA
jgi:hypothetical protein